jgi:hypothetical protein
MNPILSQLNPILNFMSHFTNINFVLTVHLYTLTSLQARHYRPIWSNTSSFSRPGILLREISPPPTEDITVTETWQHVLHLCHDCWWGMRSLDNSWKALRGLSISDIGVLDPVKLWKQNLETFKWRRNYLLLSICDVTAFKQNCRKPSRQFWLYRTYKHWQDT